MSEIQKNLSKHSIVYEVLYDKPLIGLITENIKLISFWVLIFSGFFTIVAIILINSSIILSIYSKRFTIKTMQLVGATKNFIRKPFIWNNVKLGLISGLIANAGIMLLILYIDNYIPEINLLYDVTTICLLFLGIIILGIMISWLSTFFAIRHFLNLDTDNLYY